MDKNQMTVYMAEQVRDHPNFSIDKKINVLEKCKKKVDNQFDVKKIDNIINSISYA